MNTPSIKAALTLAGAALLAGCAYPSPQKVASLNALVGQPEVTLVRQYGVPSRSYETDGHKFLAYSEHRVDYIPGDPGFGYGGFGWGPGFGWGGYPGYGWGGGFAPDIIQRDCETTFELTAGRVQSWNLKGNACG